MFSAISGCSGRVTLTCKAPSDLLATCRGHTSPYTKMGKFQLVIFMFIAHKQAM